MLVVPCSENRPPLAPLENSYLYISRMKEVRENVRHATASSSSVATTQDKTGTRTSRRNLEWHASMTFIPHGGHVDLKNRERERERARRREMERMRERERERERDRETERQRKE
jgi:hypothetical protein